MRPTAKAKLRTQVCILGPMLLVIAVACAWFVKRVATGGIQGPGIFFEHKYYDAGAKRSYSEQIVRHRFPFRNHGTRTLRITDIKTDCGCSVVDKPKRSFAPGERGFLNVVLTLASLGRKSSNILVYSNAASSPDRLTITAAFDPEAVTEAHPVQLQFDEVYLGDPTPKLLSINAFTQERLPIRIKHIESQFNQVETKPKKITASEYQSQFGYYRTTFQLEVFPHKSNVREFRDRLTISFDPPFMPVVHVSVTGHVVPTLVFEPHKVFFVLTERDERDLTPKTLFLHHVKHKHLSLVDVTNPFSAWLEVRAKTTPDRTKLKIVLEPQYAPGPIDGHIEVTVQPDGETPKSAKIPVAVRIL